MRYSGLHSQAVGQSYPVVGHLYPQLLGGRVGGGICFGGANLSLGPIFLDFVFVHATTPVQNMNEAETE